MKIKWMFFLLPVALLLSCKSLRSTETPEQLSQRIKTKVENMDFTFEPVTAHSMRFGTVRLQPDYLVRVSKDTLRICLPYYGKAYSVPLNTMNGGFNFTSTKFEHTLVTDPGSGCWRLSFKLLDKNSDLNLFMEIWNNGNTRVSVIDPDKQAISYEGSIDN